MAKRDYTTWNKKELIERIHAFEKRKKYGLLWERFLGFDDRRFVKEADFGFDEDLVQQAADKDLQGDRELEEDLGGVDRY